MASRYDDLDASLELEQRLAADLTTALAPRGCDVVHNGTNWAEGTHLAVRQTSRSGTTGAAV
jgi:hypothetical protein